MPPLTLVQKRALLAAANNVHKKERAYNRAFRESISSPQNTRQATRQLNAAVANLNKAGEVLYRLAEKLGVNANAINYHTMSRNVISNVIKKHGFGPRLEDKIWRRGYEAEMERARANFRNFAKGVFHQKSNLIGESHRKKTPSPPKRVTPRRASPPPANNAHRRVHGIGPANNTRITWSRNANGKISIHKTLRNLNLGISQVMKNILENMPQNQAINAIRQMARER
jgi:hypothetical protein